MKFRLGVLTLGIGLIMVSNWASAETAESAPVATITQGTQSTTIQHTMICRRVPSKRQAAQDLWNFLARKQKFQNTVSSKIQKNRRRYNNDDGQENTLLRTLERNGFLVYWMDRVDTDLNNNQKKSTRSAALAALLSKEDLPLPSSEDPQDRKRIQDQMAKSTHIYIDTYDSSFNDDPNRIDNSCMELVVVSTTTPRPSQSTSQKQEEPQDPLLLLEIMNEITGVAWWPHET